MIAGGLAHEAEDVGKGLGRGGGGGGGEVGVAAIGYRM